MEDNSLNRAQLIALIKDLSTELVYMCGFAISGPATKAALDALKLAERAESALEAEEKALDAWYKQEFGEDA